jgi:hypothetical protein
VAPQALVQSVARVRAGLMQCHSYAKLRFGVMQGLELGYWLRQQYIDTHGFLPATFNKGERSLQRADSQWTHRRATHVPRPLCRVCGGMHGCAPPHQRCMCALCPFTSAGVLRARTTNFSRTKATMASVLTGLFPGGLAPVCAFESWLMSGTGSVDVTWYPRSQLPAGATGAAAHRRGGTHTGTSEPIPVVTSGDLDEILFADTKRCPHLKVLMTASEAQLKGGTVLLWCGVVPC